MRRIAAILLILIAFPAPRLIAQERGPADLDLGSDISGYQRFLVYPHLQKGLDSMERGDRTRALAEFERARELAPKSAVVALHLANGYRRAGNNTRAEAVLREQLAYTPKEPRVTAALSELTQARTAAFADNAAPVPPPVTATSAPVTTARVMPPPSHKPAPTIGGRQKANSTVAATEAATHGDALRSHFKTALDEGRFDDAGRAGHALLLRESNSVGIVDEVSYQLAQAGASDSAVQILMTVYPFSDGTADERGRLLDRLSLLVLEHPAGGSTELVRLREPLDLPALRSRQGALWTELKDCDAVRAVLGDMSTDYSYDDLLRLGNCSAGSDPVQAQSAYTRAHNLQPGGPASLALGYQAYVTRDLATSLEAWRSVPRERLPNEHRLAAATTAVEIGEVALAGQWLGDYRAQGGALDHRFWSLFAWTRESAGDVAGAIDALEHATALQPGAADYVNLARLEREPERQVRWLQQAVSLDRQNVHAHLELAYAYQRAGRSLDAVRTLESAAAVAPDDMGVQLELGYAYWQQGKVIEAEPLLLRAWEADRDNIAAASHLVYVSQRLGHNQQSRMAAERVLDSLPPTDDVSSAAGREVADRRFGLQRLHEDLGRRLTLGLDGWSGTQVGAGSSTSDAGRPYRSYSQLEFDYRIGKAATRNGRTVSAYARLLADGGVTQSAVPTENPRLGVGLRWKPLGSQVLYVAAEHQQSLDGAPRREVLLRASASFLNGQRHGDDWQPTRSSWVAYNLYLDVAHYIKNSQTAAAADFRTSLHLKLGSRHTFEPYGHVQASGVRSDQVERDIRVGLGSRWNVWHGRSRYDADPGKFSVGVEFQRALDTYLPDRSGLFLTFGSRW